MKPKIIFFDGVCNLCNGFVDFLIRHDHKQRFLYASLQGETAATLLEQRDRESLSTVVYYDQGTVTRKSRAVIKIFSELGGVWRLLAILRVVPPPLADSIYNLISRNRYRWFGKRESCRLPTPQERALFRP
jgi:predicted DCC family thiol-disulfide oxidoreductase YuxK